MVSCFAAGCNHTNESHHCKFYRFPSEETHKSSYAKWIALSRPDDAKPKVHSRLCSCHFKYGLHKLGGEYVMPTIFRNKNERLPQSENHQKKRRSNDDRANLSHKQMKTSKVAGVMASGSHGSNSNLPRNSILVHGVPVQNLPQMQGTHGIQRAQQMAPVHHQPQVQTQAAAQHQFLTAGRASAPQSKYADLLAVIEDMGRDIRPTYAGSRMATERLKRGIVHAKSLVRECLAETERSARN